MRRITAQLAVGFFLFTLSGTFLSGCGGNPQPAAITPEPTHTVPVGAEKPGQGGAPPIFNHQSSTPNPQPPTPNSQPLLGRRIGLDPGHGPRDDLGAVLVDPDTQRLILSEDELDLDVALRCRDLLVKRGAEVVLTRETKDAFTKPWPPDANGDSVERGQSDDLQQRVDILNDFRAEAFLSIHANSASNPAKRQGIQALYCATEDCAFPNESKRLGKLVLDRLEAQLAGAGYPVTQRELLPDFWADFPGQPPSHLFLLGPATLPRHPRATQMPGVVVEALYVTSPIEAVQLRQDAVRQAIAVAYADALEAYLLGGE